MGDRYIPMIRPITKHQFVANSFHEAMAGKGIQPVFYDDQIRLELAYSDDPTAYPGCTQYLDANEPVMVRA